ncbi:MAG: 2-oxoacid:acceptor oxidoreductase family protein, partial [Gammaproteobacteria bacterium]|nr:2-oxoacid:acceptor oxidoreductase family protein [Gammaproteobacteria bacterium]
VITIGALLGMAAHLEGMGCSVLDMTGLAQKGGAVMSHIVLANYSEDLSATHVPAGGANLLLGCDMVVAAADSVLATARRGVTHAVINTYEMMTGDFTRHADTVFPAAELSSRIRDAIGIERTQFVDANRIAKALLGDSIGANLFMLGFAFQLGAVPLSSDSITRAIDLNGVAVAMNNRAFTWGRRAALDLPAVLEAAGVNASAIEQARESLDAIVTRREAHLCAYQNEHYGARYRRFVERVAQTEKSAAEGMRGLAEAVAYNYCKLLAYKDEYEVARLYASREFTAGLNREFDGHFKLQLHLAPPVLSRRDPFTGEPRKWEFGPWILKLFGVLAKWRSLRGTLFDPFGYSVERRLERRLIEEYEQTLDEILAALNVDNHGLAVQIASLPDQIRGFGLVKRRHIEVAQKRQAELMDAFRSPVAAGVAV